MLVKRFLEYEHEVMFRILHNGGSCSFSTIEPGILNAATFLEREGYLLPGGDHYWQGGRWRYPFKLNLERVTIEHLKVSL